MISALPCLSKYRALYQFRCNPKWRLEKTQSSKCIILLDKKVVIVNDALKGPTLRKLNIEGSSPIISKCVLVDISAVAANKNAALKTENDNNSYSGNFTTEFSGLEALYALNADESQLGSAATNSVLSSNVKLVSTNEAFTLLRQKEDVLHLRKALSMFAWLDKWKFCPKCRSELSPDYSFCSAQCKQCGTFVTSEQTTVECLVMSPTKTHCLLSQKFRAHLELGNVRHLRANSTELVSPFNTIGGYLCIGETPEESARRIVAQQVGVELSSASFVGVSNVWPFPHSALTFGCLGVAASDKLSLQYANNNARWFTVDEIAQSLLSIQRHDSSNKCNEELPSTTDAQISSYNSHSISSSRTLAALLHQWLALNGVQNILDLEQGTYCSKSSNVVIDRNSKIETTERRTRCHRSFRRLLATATTVANAHICERLASEVSAPSAQILLFFDRNVLVERILDRPMYRLKLISGSDFQNALNQMGFERRWERLFLYEVQPLLSVSGGSFDSSKTDPQTCSTSGPQLSALLEGQLRIAKLNQRQSIDDDLSSVANLLSTKLCFAYELVSKYFKYAPFSKESLCVQEQLLGHCGLSTPTAVESEHDAKFEFVPAKDALTYLTSDEERKMLVKAFCYKHIRTGYKWCSKCSSALTRLPWVTVAVCSNPACAEQVNPLTPEEAITIACLVTNRENNACLLIRKPSELPGKFNPVSGRLMLGETLDEAVDRILLEVLGVAPDSFEFSGVMQHVYATDNSSKLVLGYVAKCSSNFKINVYPELAAEARWFPQHVLAKAVNRPLNSSTSFRESVTTRLLNHWLSHVDSSKTEQIARAQ